MEASFVLYVLKILFFSTFYGTILFILLITFFKIFRFKIKNDFSVYWIISTFLAFSLLLVNIFLLDGYRGMGLFKVYHMENGKVIKQDRYKSEEGFSYIETRIGEIEINRFYIKDDLLYAEIVEDGIVQPRILIWHTFLDKIQESNLTEFKSKNYYPKIDNFKSFDGYYNGEWNGWRSWLLP